MPRGGARRFLHDAISVIATHLQICKINAFGDLGGSNPLLIIPTRRGSPCPVTGDGDVHLSRSASRTPCQWGAVLVVGDARMVPFDGKGDVRSHGALPWVYRSQCLGGLTRFSSCDGAVEPGCIGAIAACPDGICPDHEDEAILLGLWRDIAQGDFDHMRETLAFLVDDDVLNAVARAMTTVMAKFIAAGLDMSELARESLKEEK